ncbi:stage II sporulation protein P [Metabacillus idriensis]|uniref:stage II sporulation protein P n=1 Tax=Metabacillus idriensis TaxID=324768 RepID=UPI00203DBEFA|nr:stage II sporulation protein P [Metabacillus idriensis]MCM3597204.1 stage II sporulation protein P [Metabacillus idriensis]
MKKSTSPNALFLPGIVVVIVFGTFLMVGVLVNLNIRYQTEYVQKIVDDIGPEQLFSYFLRAENHYFHQPNEAKEDLFSIGNLTRLSLQLSTNIIPEDARTFLGRELPGLSYYDTEISVAGEGVNLATLPMESSPPLDVLLKEREIAEDQLKGREQEVVPQTPNTKVPAVFVYQTHSWESFLPLLKNAKVPNDATSNDNRVNVIALGTRLSNNLLKKGIGVKHDQTNMTQELHKRKWKDTKSYNLSGEIVQATAKIEGDLEYYIDIHRDSARKKSTTKTINGKDYARLYFVIGKGHAAYEKNEAFAKKLHYELEKRFPGISKGVYLKKKTELTNGIYNQEVSDRAILLEVGGVDNNLDELERSVDAFAEVFSDVYWTERKAQEVNGDAD